MIQAVGVSTALKQNYQLEYDQHHCWGAQTGQARHCLAPAHSW